MAAGAGRRAMTKGTDLIGMLAKTRLAGHLYVADHERARPQRLEAA
jgi:hypothetical protein